MLFEDDRFADYKVNLKHKGLRIAGFIVLVLIAIGSITTGVLMLSHKDKGFYVINASMDSEAVNYAKNTELHYYMEGSTSEIKDKTRQVTLLYSQSLAHIYKLLDAENIYTGYENIASINAKRGEYVNVGSVLYEILKDAYAKTCEQEGFNMFAGNLYERWANILILYDYENFDPINDAYEKDIITKLSKYVNDFDNFSLDFRDEDKAVRLTVSKEYDEFVKDNELLGNVLDLNLLKEAYLTKYVTDALEDKGFSDGYITTNRGLTITLSSLEGCQYPIYALDGGEIVIKEIKDAAPGSVHSAFNHFQKKETDILYQKLNVGNNVYYRSPYSNLSPEGYSNLHESYNTIVYALDPVEASYTNIKLINVEIQEELDNTLSAQIKVNQSLETKKEILVY